MTSGRLKDPGKIERRLGRLEERYPQGWSMLSAIEHRRGQLWWSWNKSRLRGAKLRQGAYLLRTNLDPMDPDALWRQYVQLTEVEAAFRALKSEFGYPSDLAPHTAPRRGSYLSSLPGLLLVDLPQAEA